MKNEKKPNKIYIKEGMSIDLTDTTKTGKPRFKSGEGTNGKWCMYSLSSENQKKWISVWAKNPEQASMLSSGTAILTDIEIIIGNEKLKDFSGKEIMSNGVNVYGTSVEFRATFNAGSGSQFVAVDERVSDEELPFN